MPCSRLKVNRLFGGTCRFQLQAWRVSQVRNQYEPGSKRSVEFHQTTRSYIPEDTILQKWDISYHICWNLVQQAGQTTPCQMQGQTTDWDIWGWVWMVSYRGEAMDLLQSTEWFTDIRVFSQGNESNRTLVNAVINFGFHKRQGISWIAERQFSRGTISTPYTRTLNRSML
jgi:hypothetical protein